MFLDSVNKSLELTAAAGATNSIVITADWVDLTANTTIIGSTDILSNGTTAVPIVSAPAASTQRKVNGLTIYNGDVAARAIIVRLNNAGVFKTIIDMTLQVDDTLGYTDTSGWYTQDLNGARKTVPSLSDVQLATLIHAATSKTTPVNADELTLWDSVTGLLNKLTWDNLKTTLATTFAAIAGSATQAFSVAVATASTHAMRQDQFVTGWISDFNAWTCTVAGVAGSLTAAGAINVTPVSAQFTVPGDYTATFTMGVKLKYTQTTVKYGYVLSSSYGGGVTTVILAPNADYLMAISAITLNSFSFSDPSFPKNINYIGAVTPGGGAYATIAAVQRYSMDGSVVTVHVSITMTDANAATGNCAVGLPIVAQAASFAAYGREITATGVSLTGSLISTSSLGLMKYDNSTPNVTGYNLVATVIYE